jgi:hypothetical protein
MCIPCPVDHSNHPCRRAFLRSQPWLMEIARTWTDTGLVKVRKGQSTAGGIKGKIGPVVNQVTCKVRASVSPAPVNRVRSKRTKSPNWRRQGTTFHAESACEWGVGREKGCKGEEQGRTMIVKLWGWECTFTDLLLWWRWLALGGGFWPPSRWRRLACTFPPLEVDDNFGKQLDGLGRVLY